MLTFVNHFHSKKKNKDNLVPDLPLTCRHKGLKSRRSEITDHRAIKKPTLGKEQFPTDCVNQGLMQLSISHRTSPWKQLNIVLCGALHHLTAMPSNWQTMRNQRFSPLTLIAFGWSFTNHCYHVSKTGHSALREMPLGGRTQNHPAKSHLSPWVHNYTSNIFPIAN